MTLTDIQGIKFVGLDNPGVVEYFFIITSGYTGFRRNMHTRGAGDKGVVGDRQKRRKETSSVLKGTNSFKDLFRESSL